MGLTARELPPTIELENPIGRIAPRSPRQNPYSERVIGSSRRKCLNRSAKRIRLSEIELPTINVA